MTTGEELKAKGMADAAAARVEWMWMAREAIDYLACTGREFTSDDLIRMVGLPRPGEGTNRNNAVGAAFSGAARRGVIERVGDRKAQRVNSHARRLTVWRGHPQLWNPY